MSIRVYVEGRVCTPEEATISVFDRGFLYGDSVYETVGTHAGKLFSLSEHLDRLERSARSIGLSLPPRPEIEDAVRKTVAAAQNPESRVRIVVTRGGGPQMDLDPASGSEPRLVVIVQPLKGPTAAMYEDGVAVEIVAMSKGGVDPSVKSGNYLNNVLALGEARRRSGAHEAILCSPEGLIAEGATSNVFAVWGGVLHTPALSVGILPGITRAKVLALARAHSVPTDEGTITPHELRAAEEVFLTSAARGVLPVTCVDGKSVGAGVPGPVTLRLRALYNHATQTAAEGQPA